MIDPALVTSLADLELVARILVEGLVTGLHRSPFHGYSAEFSQYRHYQPGDDVKYVDWKLAARTGRVYTKQFRETTNMASALVVDTSASMDFGRVTKFRYATILAAALAHVVSTQGDAVGLVTRDRFLPARSGRRHLRALLAALGTLSADGVWQPQSTVRLASERLRRKGLLVVISDFYDEEEPTFAELRRAARQGHELVLVQVVAREEIEFPYDEDIEFTDAESGRRVAVNGPLARREYKDAVASFLERWRSRAAREGFQYSLVVTDTPPDRALRNLLLARA